MNRIGRLLVDLLLIALVGVTNLLTLRGVREPWVVVVLVTGGVLSVTFVALRKRMPGTAFVVQVVWCTVAQLPGGLTPVPALLVGLYAVAARRPLSWLWAALVACLLPATVYAVNWGLHLNSLAASSQYVLSAADVALAAIVQTIFMLIVPAAVVAATGYRLPRGAVARRAAAAEVEARHEERLVVARELHDIVAHSVSIMVLQAAGARGVLDTDPARAAKALDVIQDASTQSMDELRRLLHLLQTDGDDDSDRPLPGIEAIDMLVTQSRAGGLRIEVTVDGEPGQLDPSVSTTAYRLVQEALTNTRKHADDNVTATVTIAWMPDGLHLTVEDRRAAPRTAPARHGLSTGHGLLGLSERVATVEGTLRAEPTPHGFLVSAVLPLARQPISGATR
ncbi:sensor histidine kinase [Actinoplanes sp. NPDC049668]|uniref:sensor histidine kinase n=1 Tax=unclassified Actinoplanes TaxID=2626549 RepID=UPI0033BF23D9